MIGITYSHLYSCEIGDSDISVITDKNWKQLRYLTLSTEYIIRSQHHKEQRFQLAVTKIMA